MNITHSRTFEDWEAATSAGLNMWHWERGLYPSSFKDKVIAWNRLHRLVEQHVQDHVARASSRKRK